MHLDLSARETCSARNYSDAKPRCMLPANSFPAKLSDEVQTCHRRVPDYLRGPSRKHPRPVAARRRCRLLSVSASRAITAAAVRSANQGSDQLQGDGVSQAQSRSLPCMTEQLKMCRTVPGRFDTQILHVVIACRQILLFIIKDRLDMNSVHDFLARLTH
ncbi:hypothetical protein DENSPDRAFT_839545 [Dentipellis sp. KUC8613]|nr:hypothetical protein DENSPDRAFT_839545 [Dentipellis sp. KUC8613]